MAKKEFAVIALLLFSLAFSSIFIDFGERKEESGYQVQVISLDRRKAQRNPAQEAEPEAALFPWATKSGEFTVTYYCTCKKCCGKDDGITFTGTKATPYETCAVDPSVIPLGSAVIVEYPDGTVQNLLAEDTGKGVKGNWIDVCVATHEEAVNLGVKTATVYWIDYGT